jgi:hypothetical protein
MGGTVRAIARIVVLVASALAWIGTAPVEARECGDADNNGSITVTDGVRVLRAAAGLPAVCAEQVCDLNLDGRITVTDGVLALRRAAQLPTDVTCGEAQAAQLAATAEQLLNIGIAALPGGAARAAQTTLCADGGSFSVEADRIDFFDCRENGFVSNGTFFLSDGPSGDVLASTEGFSELDLATGETLTISGTLSFLFEDTDTLVNGTLTIVSNQLGTFDETLDNVVLDFNGDPTSGTLRLDVVSGQGGLARVRSLDITFFGTLVTVADIVFTDGSTQGVFVDDGAGVCTPCVTDDDCNEPLLCFSCDSECTGSVFRCSVPVDFVLECDDGFF